MPEAAAKKAPRKAKKAVAKKKTTAKKTTARKTPVKRTAKAKAAAPKKAVDFSRAEEVAKQVWFAGLGAYGLSFDELKSNYAKVNEQSQKLFKELVSRGERLQGDAESAIKEQRESIEGRFTDARKSVDDLVEKVDVSGRVKQITGRIESLSADLRKAV